jgi:hypothetical protein
MAALAFAWPLPAEKRRPESKVPAETFSENGGNP